MLSHILIKLKNEQPLSQSDVRELVAIIDTEKASREQMGALLSLLDFTTIDLDTYYLLIQEILSYSKRIEHENELLDVCGTGGSRLQSFNISTGVAIIVAALGIPVAKHGNRKVSSNSGSSDILEALGIQVDGAIEAQTKSLNQKGLAYLHAPNFHPIIGKLKSSRECYRLPTIFNVSGPLLHPAKHLDYQLVGISNENYLEKYAQILQKLGRKKALVVCGENNLDEISLSGTTKAMFVSNDEIKPLTIDIETLGFTYQPLETYQGFSPEKNAEILVEVLQAKRRDAYRDVIVLNAIYAIYTVSERPLLDIKKEIEEALDCGKIYQFLNDYIQFTKEEVG